MKIQIIDIPRNAARTFDIDRAAEMIEIGRNAAEEALGQASESTPTEP